MKKVAIALVGAGQIGSRHLQAVALLHRWPLDVHVVEPDPVSVGVARARLSEIVLPNRTMAFNVAFYDKIEQLPERVDIGIIATSAVVRRQCVEKLLGKTSVRHLLLEKVLFQKEEDYLAAGQILQLKSIPTWVNCPRRLWPVYQNIRDEMAGALGSIDMLVAGTNWGLGCNAVHFLDLFAYLTGESDLELSNRQLDPDPIPSKRAGHLEFTGLITGKSPRGNTVSLLSNRSGSLPLTVSIAAGQKRFHVMEDILQVALRCEPSWKWDVQGSAAPRQSELTNKVVEMLCEKDWCPLTNYQESTRIHLALVRCLNTFLEQRQGTKIEVCPIT